MAGERACENRGQREGEGRGHAASAVVSRQLGAGLVWRRKWLHSEHVEKSESGRTFFPVGVWIAVLTLAYAPTPTVLPTVYPLRSSAGIPRTDGPPRADWALRIDRWFDGIVGCVADEGIEGARAGDQYANTGLFKPQRERR